jgi:hypothetical protein
MVNKVIKNALIADKCADSVTKNLEFAITRTRQATHQQKRKDGKMSKSIVEQIDEVDQKIDYLKNSQHIGIFGLDCTCDVCFEITKSIEKLKLKKRELIRKFAD